MSTVGKGRGGLTLAAGIAAKLHAAKTDGELFTEIAKGDLGPLGELFDRYSAPTRQFVLRIGCDAKDADDVVQETFLTAARAAASYDGRPSAKPFLLGVSMQVLRHRRRSLASLRRLLEGLSSNPPPPVRTPEEAFTTSENESGIRQAISKLSEARRATLILVEWEGMSGPDAAAALKVPVGTVWRRLHEAREEIRRTLERRGRR